MATRFANLKKVSKEPAARMLALANARLETKLAAPASAGVSDVLAELEMVGAQVDMLRLISVALPPRERTWWACLAARDLIGPDPESVPPALSAAEGWVRKPGEDTRQAVRAALDLADVNDDTSLCATAAVFGDGTLGPGDMAQHPAPPGAAEAAAFGMNLIAIGTIGDDFCAEANRLIDRGLDIARGGTGRPATAKEKA